MINFPNCKINLGLSITGKFPDGYHRIETLIVPLPLSDILETVPAADSKGSFSTTGLSIAGNAYDNLCYKAWKMLDDEFHIGQVEIHLHKIVPAGAGLGGGSSDAAFMLKMLNSIYNLGLDEKTLAGYAARLGMDCPFFVANKPAMATGRGEILDKFDLNLSGIHVAIVKPQIHISTAEAYAGIVPNEKQTPLAEILAKPISDWKNLLINDFEASVFRRYPQISEIKEQLYNAGAVYAAMSGSGSAVFGLFGKPAEITNLFPDFFVWEGCFS
jgi:4-diphosphocytidyl-2-C-methyl-D-erythritol kinase